MGNFTPGSLTPGPASGLPPYFLSPSAYSTTVPAANLFPGTFYGMNPNLQQPYLEQWNFGVQRSLGKSSALEVRYVGNLALHQWLAYNLNEVNVFENGFLGQFTQAQSNLTINQANGKGASFANNGLSGQATLPIFASAFGTATSNYTNGTYITYLQTGAAGSFANSLAGNTTFFCNMVGTTAFPACATKGTFAATGAYPINFWQANPFASGKSVNYLDSPGSSNYEGLQIEFRQRPTHGAQFTVNYTWAHSLGISAQNGIQGQGNNIYYTDRNFRLNYGPGLFDIRHVVHASGTYDLPFGAGRKFLDHGSALNRAVGGLDAGHNPRDSERQSRPDRERRVRHRRLQHGKRQRCRRVFQRDYRGAASIVSGRLSFGKSVGGNRESEPGRGERNCRCQPRACDHAWRLGLPALHLRPALVQRRSLAE